MATWRRSSVLHLRADNLACAELRGQTVFDQECIWNAECPDVASCALEVRVLGKSDAMQAASRPMRFFAIPYDMILSQP